MIIRPHIFSLATVTAALAATARADVKLPAIISDHMVLQQEAKAQIWGWADPGEKITVKFGGETASTEVAPNGKWKIQLPPVKPGTSGDLRITGKNEIVVKDVLVGEVWVCSGQSNMEWPVSQSANPQQEIAEAKHPQIRMFTVRRSPSSEAKEDCQGEWKVCSPETAGAFSAVGYYFGRELRQKLDRPVGLIHTSWGGTPAQFWTPPHILEVIPGGKKYIDRWEQEKASLPKAKAAYEEAKKKWEAESEAAKSAGKPVPRPPSPPRGDGPFGAPGCLWNGMIAPIVNYTIQGAIWYQGEANASSLDAKDYRVLFPGMIVSWRQEWARGGLVGAENPEFPFLFVQLANFRKRHEQPVDSWWAELRESQLVTLELPRTGMAVAIDIGEADDIHPRNKQEVGRRLAISALAQVYYVDLPYSGPIYAGSQVEEGRIRLSFRNSDGLKAADGGKVKGFAVAGEDQKFAWADVQIEGDHVLVSSPQVAKPVAVRYGWADNPEVNLVNSAGLPASPFRSDDWPQNPPPTN
jgi:sialate O-acetylesterase